MKKMDILNRPKIFEGHGYAKVHKLAPVAMCLAVMTLSSSLISSNVNAQVENQGINTASNLAGSFSNASLVRDSSLNEPLDLLNDFYPSIEVRLENHSNVRRRHDARESDTKLIVEPGLAYRTNVGRHAFYAAYSGRFDRHQSFDSEDSNSHNLNAKIGLDVTHRWDVDVFASVGTSREERGVSGTRDFFIGVDAEDEINTGRDRIDYQRYGVDLIYGKKLDKLKVVLGYDGGRSRFRSTQGSELLAGDRDRKHQGLHFDVEYRIASKVSVFGRVEYSTVDFDRSTGSLDSDQVDWLVGVRIKPTARLSGVVGYGQTDRDFDERSLAGFDGNSYYANLTYKISPFSTINFGAARSIEEPSSTLNDANFFVSELVSLSWSHALNDNLTFGAYTKLIDDDFNNGREDDFFDWGLSLDYAIKSWLTLGLYYEDIDRNSNFDDISFDDRVVGLRLRSDLRSFVSSKRDVIEPSSFSSTPKSQFKNNK